MTKNLNDINQTKELVINWHVTEACNYSCQYCFAKWNKPDELHRDAGKVIQLIRLLAEYFIYNDNPLKSGMGYETVRLNLAGGEPLLLKNRLFDILDTAKQAGFTTSLITNGHYLTDDNIKKLTDYLSLIGISFDSQIDVISTKIGRVDNKERGFNRKSLIETMNKFRKYNPSIQTKINTVVNQLNWQEDMNKLIATVNPDKWKVLQVLPYQTNSLMITDMQFSSFLDRHKNLPIYPESNKAMTQSYLMLDPLGRLYQNTVDSNEYDYSEPVTSSGISKAMASLNFDILGFSKRYERSELKSKALDVFYID